MRLQFQNKHKASTASTASTKQAHLLRANRVYPIYIACEVLVIIIITRMASGGTRRDPQGTLAPTCERINLQCRVRLNAARCVGLHISQRVRGRAQSARIRCKSSARCSVCSAQLIVSLEVTVHLSPVMSTSVPDEHQYAS